jgi:molybdenum cofactor synthesis domain-containing protein|tara:strand:+ start:68775 stop:69527 length:753 start_codon:yes stop_codon:yes gene_type:complete
MVKKVRAALIIIGDEILSGRTHDANLNYIAKWLGDLGIILDEVRVIPDVANRIQETVNDCRTAFDYVFTTGGIGPTHDDITAANVAAAFGVQFSLNEEARKLLEDNMGKGNLTEARLRMAMIPEGASLIKNPVSAAPGFQLENVFVLAGIPVVMQSMLLDVEDRVSGGSKITSKALHVFAGESQFADILVEIEQSYEYLSIGSYPFYKAGSYGASFVLRSEVASEVDEALELLMKKIQESGTECFAGEAP